MANRKQLKILKQGVDAWNQWRITNLGTKVDMSKANLSKANLSTANLSKANLSTANLSKANLIWANFRGADLSGADLSGADLSGAILSGANLSGANLTKTNLFGVGLSEVDVSEADLSKAIRLGKVDVRLETINGVEPTNQAIIDIVVSENISPSSLSRLLNALNTLHKNVSGWPLKIDSIKIGLPDYIFDFPETWKTSQ